MHDAVYDEFERLFAEQMAAQTVGDPMLDTTDVGPLASEQQRDDIEHFVADAVAKGAKVLCGGRHPRAGVRLSADRAGRDHARDASTHRGGLRAGGQPLPGPDIDKAVELANGTEFGLGANAWTSDNAERTGSSPSSPPAWSQLTAT